MALPFLQIMIGIGVGVIGFLLLRPRRLQYDSHQTRNQGNNQSRSSEDCYSQKQVGETCMICLEKMTVPNIKQLKCGHALHKVCYAECLKNRIITCPTCREKMS